MVDVLGLGANIITFIVVAAQLAKKTHETFSAIVDGPEIVRRVANQINQIYWILEGLKRNRTALDDPGLTGHLQLCFNEISSAAVLVEKLQLCPAERRDERLWKRIRVFLNERDLERLYYRLTGIASSLSLRMQGISSALVYELKPEISMLRRRIESLDQSMQLQTRTYTSDQKQSTEAVERNAQQQSESLKNSLHLVQNDIINSSHAVSQAKEDTMFELIANIKTLLLNQESQQENHTAQKATPKAKTMPGTGVFVGDDKRESEELVLRVERLSNLFSHKAQSVNTYLEDKANGEVCDLIIEDLRAILELAAEHGNLKSTDRPDTILGEQNSKLGLRRLKRAFGQHELQINERFPKRRKVRGNILKSSRSYTSIDLGIGTMRLMYEQRQHSFAMGTRMPHCPPLHLTDYTMSATFYPADAKKFHMIVAATIQEQGHLGAISSVSSLSVNRIIPAESHVFQMIEHGNLKGLKEMLTTGQASLRDHDEWGASLLFYSLEQPDICKFLIEEGLDVDQIGKPCDWGVFGGDWYECSALDATTTRSAFTPNQFNDRLACQRLLLEAGADPTIIMVGTEQDCFLWEIARYGSAEAILMAFNPYLSGHLTTINSSLPGGDLPLLERCENDGSGYDVDSFKAILSLGADLTARDCMGRTCLHKCISNLQCTSHNPTEEYEAIRYLVSQGADVKAVDDDGLSVSTYAYTKMLQTRWLRRLSYAGDLWDSVLQSCGYDIREFRCVHVPRFAQYCNHQHFFGERDAYNYQRSDFEELWRGREQFCPYWDDEPWPRTGEEICCSCETSDAGTDSGEECGGRSAGNRYL